MSQQKSNLHVQWLDEGREPQGAPNPKFPMGVDLDLSKGQSASCRTALPYPARRCGLYIVACDACGQRVSVTTAGRIDDPRSVRIACRAPTGSKLN